MDEAVIVCSAGCKRTAILPEDGRMPDGWDFLAITNRWRCVQCWRDLNAAATLPGAPSADTPDTLPPDSIGALKKLPEPPPLHEKVKP